MVGFQRWLRFEDKKIPTLRSGLGSSVSGLAVGPMGDEIKTRRGGWVQSGGQSSV